MIKMKKIFFYSIILLGSIIPISAMNENIGNVEIKDNDLIKALQDANVYGRGGGNSNIDITSGFVIEFPNIETGRKLGFKLNEPSDATQVFSWKPNEEVITIVTPNDSNTIIGSTEYSDLEIYYNNDKFKPENLQYIEFHNIRRAYPFTSTNILNSNAINTDLNQQFYMKPNGEWSMTPDAPNQKVNVKFYEDDSYTNELSSYINYNGGILKDPNIQLSREGYTFDGWRSSKDGSIIDFSTTPVSYDLNIYAKWEPIKHEVTFVSNGGTELSKEQVGYNTKITRPTNPSKEGYTFVGWFKDADLINEWDFDVDTMPNENLTLFAKYEKIKLITQNYELLNTGSNLFMIVLSIVIVSIFLMTRLYYTKR